MDPEDVKGKRIAVPGKMTTAYLALKLFQPDFEAVVTPFDKILDAVRERSVDAGLIIHEAQLTYEREGFHRVIDLGKWWKGVHGLPLPLGGNALLRSLPAGRSQRECCRLMRESIQYAFDNHDEALDLRAPVRARHGYAAGGQVRGDVRQPLHAGCRRTVVPAAVQKMLDLGYDAGSDPLPHAGGVHPVGECKTIPLPGGRGSEPDTEPRAQASGWSGPRNSLQFPTVRR